jgi:hypothetical protein
MRSVLHQLTNALVLTMLLWLTAAAAQQPATGRQKAPRLTTDDLLRPPAAQPSADSRDAATKPEDVAKADPVDPKAGQPKATEVKVSDEESSWRERVGKARTRAKELERAAEEAELRITALRNELGTSGQSARFRNDTAAELGQAGPRLTELRAQARVAADDAAQLIEYGKTKGFTESEGPKPTGEEGKPNEDYYRTQFTKQTEALENAQRRVQLYDNRVRDLNQQISTNSGGKDKNGRNTGGDSFYGVQLQKDREEAQQKLEEARAAQTQAQSALDALMEEARRAGVPPGLFR